MALTDNQQINDDIIDINIDGIKKQRFRINGRPDSIIELNLSDLSIDTRLEKGFKKLQEKMSEISEMPNDAENLSELLERANKEMCDWVDYIFDSPVSEVLSRGGTMYDPKNGMFRYEHIIDCLTKLYTNNLNSEYKQMKNRISKYTDKYTNKSTKKG